MGLNLQSEADHFLKHISPAIEPSSVDRYRKALTAFVRGINGHELTTPVVTGWMLDQVKVHGLEPATAAYNRRMVKRFFVWLKEQGKIAKVPLDATSIIPVPDITRIPGFTEEEFHKILAYCRANSVEGGTVEPYWVYAVQMGWYTGQRLSDVCCVKWGEIDFNGRSLLRTLRKTRRKCTIIEVPLPSAFVAELKANWEVERLLPQVSDYVYHEMAILWYDRNGRQVFLFKQFSAILEGAGVPSMTPKGNRGFHSFRRAFITRNLSAGKPPNIIAKLCGISLATMNRYNQPTLETTRSILGYD